MNDSTERQGPRPRGGCWLPGIAAAGWWLLAARHDTSMRLAPAQAVAATCVASLALLGGLPVAIALADPGRVLALRAREQVLLGGDRPGASRWVDLAGPTHLALLTCLGLWLLAAAWAGRLTVTHATELALVALVLRLAAEVALGCWRPGDTGERSLLSVTQAWRPLLLPWMGPGREIVPAVGEPADAVSDALAEAIEVGDQEGELTLGQSNLLRREIDFARTAAEDIMVPWQRVHTLSLDLDFQEVLGRVGGAAYSRFPVYDPADGEVVAILHAKELLPYVGAPEPGSLRKLLTLTRPRKPVRVLGGSTAEEVLTALRQARVSMAVVADEQERTLGIVTVEDVVEELFGDIADESDPGIVRERLRVDGRRTLGELQAQGVPLVGEPETTLAEFLSEQLGDELADEATWASGAVRLTVDSLDADGGIDEVRVDWVLDRSERRP